MSRADGWDKIDAHEWRKVVGDFRMVIDYATGNSGAPFCWYVYKMDSDKNGLTGKREAVARGYARRLCDAKARATDFVSER